MLPDLASLSRHAVRYTLHNHQTCMSLTGTTVPRSFIQSAYPVIKRHNPDLPVLIREANGVPARIFARFGVSYITLQVGLDLLAASEKQQQRRVWNNI